jgi:hypothetical protein
VALHEAVFGAIADLTHWAINLVAMKIGKSEVEVKQIENFLFWFVFLSFISFICYITFKYS